MNKPFDECPVCGGELVEKRVTKLLEGGNNVVRIMVDAEVCLKCRERLYSSETIRRFEEIRRKLAAKELEGFRAVGETFEVV